MNRIASRGLLILVFASASLVDGGELVLTENGKTPFVIVLPAQSTAEESTAAEWLAAALKQATGADFAIHNENAGSIPEMRLFVGATAAAREAGFESGGMQPEEWRVRTSERGCILTGGRPRGTIYAVTEFLEQEVGVLLLDPFTEVIPDRPSLSIPVGERSGRPAFPVRAVFTGFPYSHPAQGGRLGEKYRVWNKNVIDGRTAVGDHVRMIPGGVHTFGNFVSSKEFAGSHPEYFGMDAGGKRITDDMGTPSAWTQLCVTNDDVRRITRERAVKLLRDERAAAAKEGRDPARWLVLSQNDNTTNLCLCSKCKAIAEREGSESGPLLEFVNEVARGLQEEFPEVLVQTEAYNFTLQAPKSVEPEANVVIRYCDNYGLSDPTHPLTHPRNEKMLNLFSGWRRKNSKLGVWDYWRVFQQHPPGFFAPSTNVRAICDDVRLFQKSGVQLMTIEIEDLFGAGINADPVSADLQSFMPLRTWVGLKLIDDPARDPDQLLDTFCRGYYGAAAQPMRRLLERIEQRQRDLATRVVDVQRHVWAQEFCDGGFFSDAFRWLDAALQATAGDAVAQTHVRRERIVVDSSYLWLEQHVRRRDPVGSAEFPSRAELLRRHREDWQAYIATVFDAEGQAIAKPIIEAGLSLAGKLKPEDTRYELVPLAIREEEATIDGRLSESFWQRATNSRLLPRDPSQSNDDPTLIRLAWTDEALYVGIDQPPDRSSAILGVTLMAADRKGVQLSLYATKTNGPQSLNSYFYDYDSNGGLRPVKGHAVRSHSAGSISDERVTTELRFLWSDLGEKIASDASETGTRDFVFNIESYPQPESKVPSHVSSPWLIGTSPTWHSGYFQSLRIATDGKSSTP